MISDVKPLEGWITSQQAAKVLGISRQAVQNMMAAGIFESLRTISAPGARPMYVVTPEEVEKVRQLRATRDADKAAS